MNGSISDALLNAASIKTSEDVQGGDALRHFLEERGITKRLVACDARQHLTLPLAKRHSARPEYRRHVSVGKLLAILLEDHSGLNQPAQGICLALADLSREFFANLDEGFIIASGLYRPRVCLDRVRMRAFRLNDTSFCVWSMVCKFFGHALTTRMGFAHSGFALRPSDCLQSAPCPDDL